MSERKIFIIDDDFDDQLLISDAFRSGDCPCNLTFAENGHQALEVIEKSGYRPDLIVLDLNMPVMNGFEFLRKFCSNKALSKIPIIVLSTTSDKDAVNNSYDLGASSFIVKPRSYPGLEKITQDLTRYWFGTVRLATDL